MAAPHHGDMSWLDDFLGGMNWGPSSTNQSPQQDHQAAPNPAAPNYSTATSPNTLKRPRPYAEDAGNLFPYKQIEKLQKARAEQEQYYFKVPIWARNEKTGALEKTEDLLEWWPVGEFLDGDQNPIERQVSGGWAAGRLDREVGGVGGGEYR